MNEITIRPYCFADFLSMKPGSLIGGLMHLGDSWILGPDWVFQAGDLISKRKSVFTLVSLLEHKVRWREKYQEYSIKIGKSRLYRPPFDQVEADIQPKNTMIQNLSIHQPVGIYLGHITRNKGVSLVNVLTGEGNDVWI